MRTRGWRALAVTFSASAVLAGVAVVVAPTAAQAAGCPVGPPAAGSLLFGVSTTGSSNAWAVGQHYNGSAYQTLAEHWNGTAWKTVASPDPGGTSNPATFNGVAATSTSNAWAVGEYCNGSTYQTLTAHWNGSGWKKLSSPSPGSSPFLFGVTATSSTNAWAVGNYDSTTGEKTLIEHWNGTAWKQVPSPSPDASTKGGASLTAVAATSTSNAWAVGNYYNPTSQKTLTLILHWNGTAWKQVPSPSPSTAGINLLQGVAATSTSNAWAVGEYHNGTAYQTLILHWNGTAWKRVPSPDPAGSAAANSLEGVTATAAGNAWAAGSYGNSAGGGVTLIVHWNGTAWKRVASPNLGTSFPGDVLNGISASSATNAWAVGHYCATSTCPAHKTLTERWKGSAWTHVVSP